MGRRARVQVRADIGLNVSLDEHLRGWISRCKLCVFCVMMFLQGRLLPSFCHGLGMKDLDF